MILQRGGYGKVADAFGITGVFICFAASIVFMAYALGMF